MAAKSYIFFTYPFCTYQNKYIEKSLSISDLKEKKLRFWVLAPFDPLYLKNGKSYVKSVRIQPRDILRNLRKKTASKSDKK